ncbi:MAG: hypothetical protein COX44_01115 [Candidatus Portnoybacteria bacterium CG23_combo_of_CG06-09_8_20_14_all_37_13]|uniref:Radical SAM core domain-containing protein n=1 Tax=Candidatus Portnoybacteria bacterium CG23_combo_of_CG06-09_8_20_14_all_37_13 TaxID=1974819 RepID=A0A2G9YDD6_9BACT|nr:MAG: hypothetical protein COX44_01115 [Candidatus Portnoybacteria bacterium CG23_combo_of_CG06-09_8_20_14_all_37_13]
MDVIWNLTRICPWDCGICCMSAIHVCATTKFIVQQKQKEKGRELRLNEKLAVLKQLCDLDFDIDFSGGDPLYFEEDFQLIDQATRWLPSRKISVSMTGSELTERKLDLLKRVGTVEFTLDNPPEVNNLARPQGYHFATVVALQECVERDIKVRAVTVLYPNTMKETNLRGVYNLLCEMGISEWELLRFYPVGRGRIRQKTIPSSSDYKETMQFLRSFRGSTKIFFSTL